VTLSVLGPGGWRRDADWPVPGVTERACWLVGPGALAGAPPARPDVIAYDADSSVGAASGRWDVAGLPGEQSSDDARSLAFTGPPLIEPLDLLGAPVARLVLERRACRDTPLVVRLADVAPSGASTLITTGWLRLDDSEEGLGQTAPRRLTVELWPTSYRVASGHRLRVCVALSDFPHIWPGTTRASIALHLGPGGSHVRLPVAPPAGDTTPPPLRARHPEQGGAHLDLATPSGDGRVEVWTTSNAATDPEHPERSRACATARARLRTPSGSTVVAEAQVSAGPTGASMRGQVTDDGVRVLDRRWTSPSEDGAR
jgi:predicted acyl esterase